MKQMKPTNRGLDIVLSIGDIIIGGQQNCVLKRGTSTINITNKINSNWQTVLAGTKNWSVQCSGVYVKDANSFTLLEQAYKDGSPLNIKLNDGNRTYQGQALIINFPAEARYNDAFTYSLTLMGTGPLE